MDILNIDFDILFPHIISVFTHLYGEEYNSIIADRINKAIILSYLDSDGISSYVSYLKNCKQREYSLEFLERIGIDTKPFKKENYTEALDDAAEKLLEPYIYSSYFGMDSNDVNYWAPLYAFDQSNIDANNDIKYLKKRLLNNRIKLINHLRGENKELLTEENFSTFTETEEYAKLLEGVNELRAIHNDLLAKYNEWAKSIAQYEEYANSERKRKEIILQKKKDELFDEIFDYLPVAIKNAMKGKTTEEQQKMFFMAGEISSRFNLETFRSENIDKLISPDVSYSDKSWIMLYQRWYLEDFKVGIPYKSISELESEEGISNHLEYLKQEDVSIYIPSEELIRHISTLREKKYEEALNEYYTTRADFLKIVERYNNNPEVAELVYNIIKEKRVCITGHGGVRNGEFVAVMFYTPNHNGHQFATLIHECGHVIDQTRDGCGFEPIETYSDEGERNPYDKKFRKYEKFNETINDMFKMEAVEFFQSRGFYYIEPQEFIKLDISNENTAAVTKDLLKPLLQRFRRQVIKAKIKVNKTELTKYIGKDNYEELVDAVNKVDYLSRNGLISKIKESPNDPMVLEYQKQLLRVAQIYVNIDIYSNQQLTTNLIYPSDSLITSHSEK